MGWDEWEQLKAGALQQQNGGSTHMRLNGVGDEGSGSRTYGDLKVHHGDLTRIGKAAHHLYNQLWDKARVAGPSSDTAARNLSSQGLTLGSGLQHVANRWEQQLKSLMDACAQISNHMHVTRRLHADDEDYIRRRMSSIATLDAGFDEQVGAPGDKNPVYGKHDKKKEDGK
jgi:hypothetical protein